MLKLHVKLLSAVTMLSLRDMEVGMVYKGNKGLPKLVVRKTKRTVTIRNISNGVVNHVSPYGDKADQNRGTRLLKVFAIAKNDTRDIEKLVTKTQSV